MLNIIWAAMIIIGIVVAVFNGSMEMVNKNALEGAKEAVQLCITMLGIVAVWTGLMEVARQSGMTDGLAKRLKPLLCRLYPGVPSGHKAMEYISINMVSNFLGLGWAATPAGLKAMKELALIQDEALSREETGRKHKWRASADMCTFLIINVSSLQLIPVSIIAYRSQYGSVNPSAIVFPAILATTASTLAGLIFSVIARKLSERCKSK